MSRVLGLCSAGPYCGVALWDGNDVTAAAHEEMTRGQAERLIPMANEVLAASGLRFDDLDALGVGIGPGNFTGVRIGVSAVRGLALGLGIPAVGVSLLDALALDAPRPTLTTIAAGRDRIYAQRFDTDGGRGPELIALADLVGWSLPGLICIGNHEETVAEMTGGSPAPAPYYPASAVARIAADRWQMVDAPPAPLYLRPPDAAPARDAPPRIVP